jgi:hypothetical protein
LFPLKYLFILIWKLSALRRDLRNFVLVQTTYLFDLKIISLHNDNCTVYTFLNANVLDL